MYLPVATLVSDIEEMIKTLNSKIIDMRNYYGLKNAGKQLSKIDWYIIKKKKYIIGKNN